MVLVRALPPDSMTAFAEREAYERSLKPTPDKIRERAAYYEQQRAKEGSDG